ncbi:hypothetical protein N2152v2_008992 [Parachlorella kessleri]
MRALVAARIKLASEAGALKPAKAKAVPCLHPSHRFSRVVGGPERAVVFVAATREAGVEAAHSYDNNRQPGSQSAVEEAGTEVAHPDDIKVQPGNLSPAAARAEQVEEVALSRLTVDSPGQPPPAEDRQAGACFLGAGHGQGATTQGGSSSGGHSRVGGKEQLSRQLEEFLRSFPASGASCRDVASINVLGPQGKGGAGRPGEDQLPGIEERVEEALEEWEQLSAPSRPPPTTADIDDLAWRHGLLAGKWMAFPRQGAEADAAWAAVARAVALEGLAPQAKISSVDPRKPDHALMVYTHNYLDVADVERVRDRLRQLLPPLRRRQLLYKPDIFTFLGIYSQNEFNLRPTVYCASL